MFLKRFPRWLKLLWLVAIAVTVIIALILLRAYYVDPTFASHRARWDQQGVSNYQMTIVATWLPVPSVAMKLTIRDGQIVNESILACDESSEDDWARQADNCDTIRTYYTYMGRYTVEKLFDFAAIVISRTESGDLVGSVEYDPVYGYPSKIMSYTPDVMDSSGGIEVREFHSLPAPQS